MGTEVARLSVVLVRKDEKSARNSFSSYLQIMITFIFMTTHGHSLWEKGNLVKRWMKKAVKRIESN